MSFFHISFLKSSLSDSEKESEVIQEDGFNPTPANSHDRAVVAFQPGLSLVATSHFPLPTDLPKGTCCQRYFRLPTRLLLWFRAIAKVLGPS